MKGFSTLTSTGSKFCVGVKSPLQNLITNYELQIIYQEGFEDGRLEGLRQAVPRLLELGLTIEQVAEGLGLTIEQVQYAKLFYEGFQEGQRIARVKLIPMLLELGVAVEQVAEAFGLSVEEVEQVTQNQSSEGCGNFKTSL